MKLQELKTINDYKKAFFQLANDCKNKFGADEIEVSIFGATVRIEFR